MESQTVVRPTAERLAKGDVIQAPEERLGRPKPWWTFEAVYDGLLAQGLISQRAWQGANEFRQAWEAVNGNAKAANLETRIDTSVGNTYLSEAESRAHKDLGRWSKLLAAEIYDCLVNIVGCGMTPTVYAGKRKWHPAAAKPLICLSLEQFALVKDVRA